MRTTGSFLMRVVAVAALLLFMAPQLPAQTPTPTQEQLQMFQGLTPEQQQALLQQLGADGSAVTSTTIGVDRKQNQNPKQNQGQEQEPRPGESRTAERGDKLPQPDVFKAKDNVLLQVDLPARELDTQQSAAAQDLQRLLRSRNPYQLDADGQLNLPGFAPIALGGLTEQQATQRLAAEVALRNLKVAVVRLPLLETGVQRLKPYGYDLFEAEPSMFSPFTEAPVPAEYLIGPGDQFNIQLFGNRNQNHRLVVTREGTISFPELGPIRVGGLTFTEARRTIESRVAQQMIGVQASVTVGDTRSISVWVLGDTKRPGSYTVSGMATMLTALYASGGVKPIGSLRDIQLKRQGQVVGRLDLYDMLIRGDTNSAVAKLLPGDAIFIPPVGATVSIDGEVKRPAIYELRGDTSIGDLVGVAGGLSSEADATRASLTRIDENGRRVVRDVDLKSPAGRSLILRNGDVVRIAALRPQLDSGVVLDGFVYRPGVMAWREGMRLTDAIGSVDELKANADLHYILIRRENAPDRRVSVLSADLAAALEAPGSAANVLLQPRDRLTVFDLAPGRERIVKPLLDELRLQADLARPTEIVTVRGKVKVPGEYPLEPGMRVSDLLRAGGNLEPAAFGGTAELARYTIGPSGGRETRLLTIDLAAVRRGDANANLELQPSDYLMIQETPQWDEEETITLRGEVRFPGVYRVRKGESLHEVIDRAGGLTKQAFPEGSAFTRRDLKLLEQQNLDRLAERGRSELIALSMQAARAGQTNAGEALLAGQSMLAQLQAARATGRFVIDLPKLLKSDPRSDSDVIVRDGDDLYIPKQRQEVTVIGEIQNSTSHLYQRSLTRTDYIKKSGGVTRRADRWRIYVVRADGSVATQSSIAPGDTIVVPVDAEKMPRLPFWQAVTQILYNVAISIAAVNSF